MSVIYVKKNDKHKKTQFCLSLFKLCDKILQTVWHTQKFISHSSEVQDPVTRRFQI